MSKLKDTAPKPADDAVAEVMELGEETFVKEEVQPKIYKLLMRGSSLSKERRNEKSHRLPKHFGLHPEAKVVVFDEKLKRKVERTIRYVEGEPSIFADEQSPDAANLAKPIMFEWGIKLVYPDEINLVQFMEMIPKNLSSKNRRNGQNALFYEINPKVEAEKSNKTDLELSRVVTWLDDTFHSEGGNAALKMYALTLGIDLKQDDHFVLNSLLKYAKKDPVDFVKGFASQAHNRKYYLMTAEQNDIIKIDRGKGEVYFGANKILDLPTGENAIDYLVKFAIDERGKKIYEGIKQKVDAKKVHDFVMAGQTDMDEVIKDVQKVIERITK